MREALYRHLLSEAIAFRRVIMYPDKRLNQQHPSGHTPPMCVCLCVCMCVWVWVCAVYFLIVYLCIDSLQPVQYCTQYTFISHKPLKTAMSYVCKSTLCVCMRGWGAVYCVCCVGVLSVFASMWEFG